MLRIDLEPKGPRGWTEHDDDPRVLEAAEAVRAALLPLTEDRRRSALILADICDGCGGDKGGRACHCRNDE